MAEHVGTVYIKVRPEMKGFRSQIEREIRKLRNVVVPVDADTEEFERKVREAAKDTDASISVDTELEEGTLKAKAKAAAKAAGSTVRFRTRLDPTGVLRDAFLTSKGIQNLLSQKPWKFSIDSLSMRKAFEDTGLFTDLVRVQFPKIKTLFRETGAAMQRLVVLGSFSDRVDFGLRRMTAGLKKIPGHLREASRAFVFGTASRATGLVTKEVYSLRGALRSLGNGFKHAGAGSAHFFRSLGQVAGLKAVRRSLGDILSKAAATATPMKAFANAARGAVSHTAAVATAMGATVVSSLAVQGAIVGIGGVLGYVVDGLKQMSGIGMLIPGILGGVGFAGATLFAGFRGLGGALAAAVDPAEDLSEHLDGLAPSAADFARAVEDISPAWRDVAKQVQGRMFKGLGDDLKEISQVHLKSVTKGMSKLGDSFNESFKWFARFASAPRTVDAVSQGFDSMSRIVSNAGSAFSPLLFALQDMGNVGLRALADMSEAWDGYAVRLANWTHTEEAQKKMRKWIDDSVEGFKDFGKTVGNLYETFKQIGNAFGVDFDSSALLAFREATDDFREWIGLADDANSRISKFSATVRSFTAPWIETFKTAWNELIPAFRELRPLIEDVSSKFAESLGKTIEWVAPKLEWFFKFLSDNKALFGTIAAALLGLRVGFAVFKLGRVLLSPFISALGGVLGLLLRIKRLPNTVSNAVGKMKGKVSGWSDKRAARKAAREERKAAREAKKQAGGGGWFSISRSAKKAEKETGKSAKKIGKHAKDVGKAGKFERVTNGLFAMGLGYEKTGKRAEKFSKKTGGKKLYSGLGTMTVAQKRAQKSSKGMSAAMKDQSREMNKSAKATKTAGKGGKFGKLAAGLSKVKDVAPKAGKGLGAVGKGVLTVGKFAAGGALRFVPVVGQLMMVYDAVRLLMFLFPRFGGLITKVFSKIGPKIGEAFSKIGPMIGKIFSGIGGKLGGFFSGIWGKLSGFFSGIGPKIGAAFSGAGTWLVNAGSTIWNGLKTGLSTGWQRIAGVFTGVKDKILGAFGSAGTWLIEKGSLIWNGFKQGVSTGFSAVTGLFASIPGRIMSFFGSAGSWLLGKGIAVIQGLANGVRSGIGLAISAAASVRNSIVGFFAGAFSWLVSAGFSLLNGLASGVRGAIGMVTGAISSVKGSISGFFSGAASWLVASGRALVQGFINGIMSMIGAAGAAAKAVVDKVRGFFPFSPAKEGPLSGKGYTTYSGQALVKDFAKGIRSEKRTAASAAGDVVGAVARQFSGKMANPSASFEKHHRRAVLDPVLESNAATIAKWRKDQVKEDKKLAAQIKKIQASKKSAADKEKAIAKAHQDAAKRNKESYKQMVDGLEKPDYSEIPRSIRGYYIEGFSGMIQDAINDSIKSSRLAERYRAAALGAVKQGRRVFGNHPMFEVIERSVTAKHFEKAIISAIEDAGIAEVPVTFVAENLNQLKSDLGMGDGVVSRLIDAAIDFEPTETDSKRHKTEVHYHVADMNEAIRLEKLRERKQMMRMK